MHHRVQENRAYQIQNDVDQRATASLSQETIMVSKTETLVVIDPSISDYQMLIDDLTPRHDVTVSLLRPDQNGVHQITYLLQQLEGVRSLHIVCHGAPGWLVLGNSTLSLSNLQQHTSALNHWFAQHCDPSLTLYGCNVAAGDAGTEFIQKLHILTSASIAASTTLTGNVQQGGDWNLSHIIGPSPAEILFSESTQQTYQGILATPVNTLLTTLLPATPSSNTLTGVGSPSSEFDPIPYTVNFGTDGNGGLGQDIQLDGFVFNDGRQFTTGLGAGSLTLDSSIQIQRTGANSRSTPFFALAQDPGQGTTINILGSANQSADEQDILNSRIINRGIEAIFLNIGQGASDIERLDYVLTTPLQTTDANELVNIGFLVVERGGNDSFKIAPILALDASGTPSLYGDLVTVDNTEFGQTSVPELNFPSVQFLQLPGGLPQPDNIFNRDNLQPVSATYISWQDLGITLNQGVFGYSIFAPDTDPSLGGTLTDINSAAFPKNTIGSNAMGGSIDLIAGGSLFLEQSVDDLIPAGPIPSDTDRDGIPDDIDEDDDNDGIPDLLEQDGGNDRDSDGDGQPDRLDLDADNDGIPDNIEAQTTTGYRLPLGQDGDLDGLDDAYDSDQGGIPIIPVNTDSLDNPDYLDSDSDNDGLLDVNENNELPFTVPNDFLDDDNDGILNGFDDVNNILIWDINDDIDNPSINLPNGDGIDDVDYRDVPDPTLDTDRDGVPDDIDIDDDNDGIPDVLEQNDGIDRNTDGDQRPDRIDLDADNDGIPDNIEAQTTDGYRLPSGQDNDNDGLDDAYDADQGGIPIIPFNFDGVDNPDYLDPNSDNDGLLDTVENNEVASTLTGIDTDQDGIDDAFDDVNNQLIWDINDDIDNPRNNLPNTNGLRDVDYRDAVEPVEPAPGDADGDGIPDVDDLDDDNDGILDIIEERGVPNRDTDGDGVPDRLDLDADNDGILDMTEAGHGQPDANGDGRVDGPFGANGYADILETAPESGVTSYTPFDTDGDGLPDFQDLDADNDSIPDVIEAGGSDPDQDGIIGTGTPVVNSNGLANDVNPVIGGTPLPINNGDGDLLPDYRDLDSDNDGLNDLVERGGPIDSGLVDTDGDGMVDGVDIDQDGIIDIVDGNVGIFGTAPSINSVPADQNDNGIPDFQELPDTLVLSDSVDGDFSDILLGFSDDDVLNGNENDTIINGGSNRDTINGGPGDDVINGGSNRDIINGKNGDDIINGGTGNDQMRGGRGNDQMNGGSGNDTMFGNGGQDSMFGGSGRDIIVGNGGRDAINGGRGNDRINGGRGKDIINPGEGRDVIVIGSMNDIGDQVFGFELIKDKFNMRRLNGGVESYSDLDIVQDGDNTLINTSSGRLIVQVNDFDASKLGARHFIF